MTVDTREVSNADFKQHLNFFRHLQHQVDANPLRLTLKNESVVEGRIASIGGNFVEIETFPEKFVIELFVDVKQLEYVSNF